jgi:putative peptidoglycan lipid II flippase
VSRTLLKSTAVVSAMTLVSRVLGFVRDIIIARIFGAGFEADAFFVAFRIPNFMRRLFAEGAFNQAFVPLLSEYKEQQPQAEVKDLVDSITGVLGTILALITVTGVLAAPWLVYLFAPGFGNDPQRYDLTVSLLRLTFPYLLFISLTALAGSILNSYGRFAVPAFTPVLLNLSLIACALLLAPTMSEPVTALAIGVFIAGLVQLGFQLPFLHRLGLLPRPRLRHRNPGVKRLLTLMVPTLLGSSVAQVNLLFDTLIASFLTAGSVSWLYYSDRLVEFPLGMFGMALGTVILPRLSRQQARLQREDFNHTLDWGMRLVILVGLPSALGLGLLAEPILSTLFQYGEFTARDATMAGHSLLAYAVGLPAFLLIRILAPGF